MSGKAAVRASKPARARFDIEALRALVGEKVFARGEAYHRDNKVEIRAVDDRRVLAQVAGTEDYRIEIGGRGTALRLACSCRAFEDFGPCKHIVATALAANADRADGPDAMTRIRAHLERQSVEALARLILELAEVDESLFRKLELAAASGGGDGKRVGARLRKALGQATHVPDYVEYGEVGGWATGVEDVLDAIAGAIEIVAPRETMELTEQAIEKVEEAIGYLDDSNGLCDGLLLKARDIHRAAAALARPDPAELARNLFAREMADEYDTFRGAARLYADVLGTPGLAEYRRLANEAWAEIPVKSAKPGAPFSFDSNHFHLFAILDSFAEDDGDVETRIALRSKDLSSAYNYFQLADFCRAQGRREEALRRAEEGVWLFEDGRPDERLVFLTARLLGDAGRTSDAAALLRETFEKAPSFELYERLRATVGEAVVDGLIAAVEAQLTKTPVRPFDAAGDLLLRILISERRFDAAWAALRRHGASTALKNALADASVSTHPADAARVWTARVDELVELGNNRAYADAVSFVARLADLQTTAAHRAYLADLKLRFGRKRNFMKLLA